MTTRSYNNYKENADDYREDIEERKDANARQRDDDKMEIVLLKTVRTAGTAMMISTPQLLHSEDGRTARTMARRQERWQDDKSDDGGDRTAAMATVAASTNHSNEDGNATTAMKEQWRWRQKQQPAWKQQRRHRGSGGIEDGDDQATAKMAMISTAKMAAATVTAATGTAATGTFSMA